MATPPNSLTRIPSGWQRAEVDHLRTGGKPTGATVKLVEDLVARLNEWADLAESYMADNGEAVTGTPAQQAVTR